MDVAAVRGELEKVGLSPRSVEPVAEQGWASWTFELDGELVVRFPRDDAVVDAMHREVRLLPALAQHVSFRVPVPTVCAEDWFVYEKIPGREVEVGDDIDAVFDMIRELHTFPIDEAARLLGRPPRGEQLAHDWRLFETEVFPLLDDELVAGLDVLRHPPPVAPSFVHDDLGPEHLLVDDAGSPVGIIDFEDATIADPAVDLMPLTVLAGRPLDERMWIYQCRGTLHALVHHVREGQHDELRAAAEELRRRLDSRPAR